MSYLETAPPSALARFVDCFWTSSAAAAAPATEVLPDGCVDLILTLGAGEDGASGGRGEVRAFVSGAMTRRLLVEHAHDVGFVAVRFRPGGAGAFFTTPQHEWTDRHVELEHAWRDATRLIDALAGLQSHGAPATSGTGPVSSAALALLARELLRRLPAVPASAARDVALADAVRNAPPESSVAGLAHALGITRQHLARTLQAAVGLGPKMLQRVARMQRTLALLRAAAPPPLAALACDCGFVDQAHLTSELKALTGRTPGAWRAGR